MKNALTDLFPSKSVGSNAVEDDSRFRGHGFQGLLILDVTNYYVGVLDVSATGVGGSLL